MRRSVTLTIAVVATLSLIACGEDDPPNANNSTTQLNNPASNNADPNNDHPHNNPEQPETSVWYFSEDKGENKWLVTVIDPKTANTLSTLEIPELGTITAAEPEGGNGAGPAWGDVNVGPSGKIFANAMNANRVAVFNAMDKTFHSLLEVGPRPVHIYHPNHSMEVWTHADGIGAFHVIDPVTLSVSEPVVAAMNGTGHGKLLYAYEIRPRFYATNTTGPGVFPIDGVSREVGEMITVCGSPCDDDASKLCGGTHDKAFNPAKNWALFQCSGAAYGTYAMVDAETNEVVHDKYPVSGSVATSKGNEFILLIKGDQVQIWDTQKESHNGLDFDAEVTIEGAPNARGIQFSKDGDTWFAWIPLTDAPSVARLNLKSLEVTMVDVGELTKPEGASHFGRRAAMGGGWLATYSDDGVKIINMETLAVVTGEKPQGNISRVELMAPH